MAARPQAARSMKIRSGDHVRGDRGQGPRQERHASCASSRPSERVYVEGLNMVKRHTRARSRIGPRCPARSGQLGGVIEREGPIHVSNVMLLDAKGKPTRVRHRARGRQARPRRQEHRRESWTEMAATTTTAPPARLKARYLEEIRPALIERFGYSSVMQAPQAREDHAEHGRRPGQAGLQSARRPRPSSSRRSPASSRACAARASRSRPSNCARACPSASR